MILLFLANVHGEAPATALNTMLLLSEVPYVRQGTGSSCGAAALQAVLSYWGRGIGEGDLVKLLNTDPDSGPILKI